MKKIICMLVAVVMPFSCLQAFAEETAVAEPEQQKEEIQLTDINSHWARDEITSLFELGIINGRQNGNFEPNADITRAEFAKMLLAAMQCGTDYADANYSDVAENEWYFPYVNAAYFEGVMLGDSDGRFYPERNITLEEVIVAANRAYKRVKSYDGDIEKIAENFTPDAQISAWARNDVMYAAGCGLLNRMYGNGNINTACNATRGETADIIYRLYNLTKN